MRLPLTRLAALVLVAGLGACVQTGQGPQIPAAPQRPRIARSPATTATETFEVEAGVAPSSGGRFDTPMELKYGINDSSDVYLGLNPFTRSTAEDGAVEAGFGNLVPGFKHRFIDPQGSRPGVAWTVSAKLPTSTTEQSFNGGELDLFGAAMANWDFSSWSFNGYYRLGLLGNPRGRGVDLQHTFSGYGTLPIHSQLNAFSELAFLWTPDRDNEQLILDGGLQYALFPGLVFDTAVYVGLTPEAPDFAVAIGLVSNFGRQQWDQSP